MQAHKRFVFEDFVRDINAICVFNQPKACSNSTIVPPKHLVPVDVKDAFIVPQFRFLCDGTDVVGAIGKEASFAVLSRRFHKSCAKATRTSI